ncbi:hypothetical protein [Falsiroseomonas tokyonensis]|uniref:Uncharacterized protein n=1 Tax=Falsiroseomonas tokyonensis TaxID=430521 RepID=A0ABV7C577_9PROT|nr:hypothetical protein [Falsiroseomonas tokyonensis]MBU8541821.1 hypothetical protein [Falsiroseomonas tokyonensis]
MRKFLLAAVATLALGSAAMAQGHADRGPHGAPMQDIVGIHAELMLAERTVTVHLYDESGSPVPAAGYTGSALVGSGQGRQVVQLAPTTENTMAGTAQAALPRGAALTLQIRNPAGRSGQARF